MLHFSLYLRAISKYKPPGGLYSEGRFNGGFSALRVRAGGGGGYTWRGLFSEFYGIPLKKYSLEKKILEWLNGR